MITIVSNVWAQALIDYVQPLSGTAGATTKAALKHSEAGSEANANTIPAVSVPFAMTQWTPQTRLTENKCIPPYFYKDSLLSGFRGTHWLSGSCTQDYGSFTIMPVTGNLKTTFQLYATPFSHQDETTTPAYYKLILPQKHLTAEVTATRRCSMMQFTMLADDSLYLLMMPNSDYGEGFVKVNASSGEIWGYNPAHRIYQGWGNPAGFSGYFYMQLENKNGSGGTFKDDELFTIDSIGNEKNIGAYIGFNLKQGDQLRIRIGTSFSSLAGAKNNLAKEIDTWNFNEVLVSAKHEWEQALGQVQVQTGNEKDKRIFYTAMYHAMQHPRLYNDADGTYPSFGGTGKLLQATHDYYDDFSMWDIYRAQLPLLEILQPKKINDCVSSLVLKGQQGGWLPIFPCWNSYTSAMIGDHAAVVIASAYTKGIRGYNVAAAYDLMRKNAFQMADDSDYVNGKGRRALDSYMKYGFIPMEDSVPVAFHKKEQVSRTLEYAYDDYAISFVAKGLHKTAGYNVLRKRALNYRNVFNKSTGMVQGKFINGKWYEPFRPDLREPYITEGTPRQYTFYVPQDVPGLAALMGGSIALERALDSLFAKNEYWHGNEPGHQIPFMYNYTASAWKTQLQVRNILAEEYGDGAGGLSGNDDAGQMSAWYVFASLGFYPLDPVSGNYMLCAPLFQHTLITLSDNKKFVIDCHKKKAGDGYIEKVTLNGKAYNKNYIRYNDIMQGGRLEIYLDEKPSPWGSSQGSRAPGLSSVQ